jgi:hypothetical protein
VVVAERVAFGEPAVAVWLVDRGRRAVQHGFGGAAGVHQRPEAVDVRVEVGTPVVGARYREVQYVVDVGQRGQVRVREVGPHGAHAGVLHGRSGLRIAEAPDRPHFIGSRQLRRDRPSHHSRGAGHQDLGVVQHGSFPPDYRPASASEVDHPRWSFRVG